jgi:hypothetical protein
MNINERPVDPRRRLKSATGGIRHDSDVIGGFEIYLVKLRYRRQCCAKSIIVQLATQPLGLLSIASSKRAVH